MKIAPRSVSGFLASPPAAVRAVLLYGPDAGLVQERAGLLWKRVVEDVSDPFRVVDLGADTLASEPARLLDEALSLSMFGGRRLLRLRDADERCVTALRGLLEGPQSDTLAILEAGDLKPNSALRQLFEKGDERTGAIACYVDDAGDVARLLRDAMRAEGKELSRDAELYLASCLTGDRQLARRAIEKLVLYMGDERTVTLEHAEASVGDSGELSLDEVAFSCVDGDGAALDNALDRAFAMGENSVRILRVVQSHILRLHLVSGLLAEGAGMDQATSQLRPPLFFKIKDRFTAQARRHAPARLSRALQRLMQTEAECKSGRGADPDLLCRQTLVGLSVFFKPR